MVLCVLGIQLHDLTTMCAMKSLCEALDYIRIAFWPLCGWNNTFCYIISNEEGPTMSILDHLRLPPHNGSSTRPRFHLQIPVFEGLSRLPKDPRPDLGLFFKKTKDSRKFCWDFGPLETAASQPALDRASVFFWKTKDSRGFCLDFGSDVHNMLALVAFREHHVSTQSNVCLHFGTQQASTSQWYLRVGCVSKGKQWFCVFRSC